MDSVKPKDANESKGLEAIILPPNKTSDVVRILIEPGVYIATSNTQLLQRSIAAAALKQEEIEKEKQEVIISEDAPPKKAYEEAKRSNDIASVKDYEMFDNLYYFSKIKFIGQCENKELLKDIAEKINVQQIKNLINKRLSELLSS